MNKFRISNIRSTIFGNIVNRNKGENYFILTIQKEAKYLREHNLENEIKHLEEEEPLDLEKINKKVRIRKLS